MVVISKTILNAFSHEHPAAIEPLNYWYEIVSKVEWANFNMAKKDFNSIDAVGNDRYVFNIKGNTFRLVAMIHFDIRTVYIRFVGTHAVYDKIQDISKI